MKILKVYLQPINKSLLTALSDFRHELLEYKLDQKDFRRFLEQFAEAYKVSDDYDLATMRVFRTLMPSISRKSSFKTTWKSFTTLNKQEKGDIVIFMNQKFRVEDVKLNYKDSKNLYTLTRLEVVDGVDIKVVGYKVLAEEGELRKI